MAIRIYKSIILVVCTLLLIIFNNNHLISGSLVELPIDRVLSLSEVVLDGEILSKKSYWDNHHRMIYTDYRISVQNLYKGNPNANIILVTCEGGIVGDRGVKVSPGFDEEIGITGVFFLVKQKDTTLQPQSQLQKYLLSASVQSFIKYDSYNSSAIGIFQYYNDRYADLIPLISTNSSNIRSIHKPKEIYSQTLIFSPQTIIGGIGSILTIKGNGFGAYGTYSTVMFSDNNNGGGGWVYYTYGSVISWNDKEIKVVVPSRAGTGIIIVQTNDRQSIESSNKLNVNFSILSDLATLHLSANDYGAKAFEFDRATIKDSNIMNSFIRAMRTWRRSTKLNGVIAESSTIDPMPFDGINSIYFKSLSIGTLAVTYYDIYSCDSETAFTSESDIAFNDNYEWHFGQSDCPNDAHDFESVALHELGHAFSLAHNNNSGSIMWYSFNSGQTQRELHKEYDIAAGAYALHLSETSDCVNNKMLPANLNEPDDAFRPAFSISANNGCAPLKVKFTGSIGYFKPTGWKWDVDNDGKYDYFSQSFTHTYLEQGIYSVKMVVYDDYGSDTVIHKDLIKILATPKLRIISDKSPNINDGDSLTLDAGSGYIYYRWSDGGDTTRKKTVFKTGYYRVFAVDYNGCSIYSQPFYVEVEFYVSLQPNPTDELLKIIFDLKGEINIKITDLLGRISIRKRIYADYNNKDKIVHDIDVHDLMPGIYSITIENDRNISTHLFVKQK